MSTAFQRGKLEDYDEARLRTTKKRSAELDAGIELREYLVDEFIAGELNNTQVSAISDMHQRNGGTGLESFARSSSSHSKSSMVKKYIQVNSQPFKWQAST